jgi:hypothetical protein
MFDNEKKLLPADVAAVVAAAVLAVVAAVEAAVVAAVDPAVVANNAAISAISTPPPG